MQRTVPVGLYLLRVCFVCLCVLMLGGGALYLGGWRLGVAFIANAAGLVGALLIFSHGVCALGGRRVLAFALLAAMTGYWAEVFSLHHGSLFGCVYHYPSERWGDMVLGMPLSVALFWAVFICGGYAVSNSFLFFMGHVKPARSRRKSWPLLLLLPVIDAVIVTAIDVYMDPLVALRGSWVWEQGGPFYGVPIGNFTGWFVIAWIACMLFRTFEYLRPAPPPVCLQARDHLIPVMAYLLLIFMFTVYSLSINRPEIALTGLFAMGPIVLLNLLAFHVHKNRGRRGEEQVAGKPSGML